MPNNSLPPGLKRDLQTACQNAGKRVNKMVPGSKNKASMAKYFNQQLCKDVDQKILKSIAKELAKQGKKHSAKAPKNTPPKIVKGVPKLTRPGKGVPSLTVPVPWSIPMDSVTGNPASKGKFELQLWADPRELEKKPKCFMVYYTVNH